MKHNLLMLFIIIIIFSCGNGVSTKDDATLSLNEFIYFTMKDSYLWYENIPEIDYKSYTDPQKLVEDLSYKTLDKWSNIIKLEKKSSELEENQYYGYGFGLIWNKEDNNQVLRVNIVYENSPAYKEGLRRGQKIKKINLKIKGHR